MLMERREEVSNKSGASHRNPREGERRWDPQHKLFVFNGKRNTSSTVTGRKAEHKARDAGRGDVGKMREFLYDCI